MVNQNKSHKLSVCSIWCKNLTNLLKRRLKSTNLENDVYEDNKRYLFGMTGRRIATFQITVVNERHSPASVAIWAFSDRAHWLLQRSWSHDCSLESVVYYCGILVEVD